MVSPGHAMCFRLVAFLTLEHGVQASTGIQIALFRILAPSAIDGRQLTAAPLFEQKRKTSSCIFPGL